MDPVISFLIIANAFFLVAVVFFRVRLGNDGVNQIDTTNTSEAFKYDDFFVSDERGQVKK
jgi:hypothetical protein